MRRIKKLLCRVFGHKMESYAYMPQGGYWWCEAEQAGYCKRCGFDTHEQEANHA